MGTPSKKGFAQISPLNNLDNEIITKTWYTEKDFLKSKSLEEKVQPPVEEVDEEEDPLKQPLEDIASMSDSFEDLEPPTQEMSPVQEEDLYIEQPLEKVKPNEDTDAFSVDSEACPAPEEVKII